VDRIGIIGFLLIVLPVAGSASAASSTRPALAALALCEAADALPKEERHLALARGLALAEAAVAENAADAKAHFAVFCTLAKQVQEAGVSLGALADVRRLRRELDLALGLDPSDPAALVAKGAMLVELPRWLGGDAGEGARLLRAALRLDPDNRAAREYLSRSPSAPAAPLD
jgi:hypothetical protein